MDEKEKAALRATTEAKPIEPLMKRTTVAELRSSNGNEITKTTVRYTSGAVIDG